MTKASQKIVERHEHKAVGELISAESSFGSLSTVLSFTTRRDSSFNEISSEEEDVKTFSICGKFARAPFGS